MLYVLYAMLARTDSCMRGGCLPRNERSDEYDYLYRHGCRDRQECLPRNERSDEYDYLYRHGCRDRQECASSTSSVSDEASSDGDDCRDVMAFVCDGNAVFRACILPLISGIDVCRRGEEEKVDVLLWLFDVLQQFISSDYHAYAEALRKMDIPALFRIAQANFMHINERACSAQIDRCARVMASLPTDRTLTLCGERELLVYPHNEHVPVMRPLALPLFVCFPEQLLACSSAIDMAVFRLLCRQMVCAGRAERDELHVLESLFRRACQAECKREVVTAKLLLMVMCADLRCGRGDVPVGEYERMLYGRGGCDVGLAAKCAFAVYPHK